MKKVGLALGGGGARGCAHVGAIRALQEAGIPIDCVAGSSMGALVGGFYATGHLQKLENYLQKIKWNDVLSQFDPTVMNSGMFKGEKITRLISQFIDNQSFEDCQVPYIAVATDLNSGQEVWLKKGKIASAIRASISLPGIFTIIKINGKYLIDGGIVNPLPVNAVRSMGAEFVIAIDLNKEYIREKVKKRHSFKTKKWDFNNLIRSKYPNMIDVLSGSVFLMQGRITEKNLEINPADVLINMKLKSTSLLDFHESSSLIQEGYRQMKKQIPAIKRLLHKT